MSKILYSIFCLFICVSLSAQQAVQSTNPFSEAAIQQARDLGEILLFESKTVDLGTIKKGDLPSFEFKFMNIGKETITYNYFDICSCTLLDVDKDQKIKPGEVAYIRGKFDSKTRDKVEPVEISFELSNIDKRNNYPYFYSVEYVFQFKQ